MRDLKLSPFRKTNPIEEVFGRYGAADYKGTLEQLQRKRFMAGGKLALTPCDCDICNVPF